jgi:hypothetical protein
LRKSDFFFVYLTVNFLVLSLLVFHAYFEVTHAGAPLREKSELVRRLELSDLCLTTEASYTRHLTQADLNTPFQDYPTSFEHFPSGSILLPTEMARRSNGNGD